MSQAMQVFSIDKLQPLTLAEFISPKQKFSTESIQISLSERQFFIADNCQTSVSAELEMPCSTTNSTSAIELIVFSDLTIASLLSILKACQLTLVALNSIVHRNNATSYRFAVIAKDLSDSKQNLVSSAHALNIEAALIENAPYLTKPGVLVMDMDSTVIQIECIDEIAALAGVGKEVALVTEQAMQGELDFAQSLHQRVATLTNAPESILAQVASDIPLMPGLETLVATLKKHQWRVAIASGGFTYFADHLKQLLTLDAAFANELEIVNGKLTGKVLGDVVDAQAKADCLKKLASQHAIAFEQTVAMGDGANDLVMMQAAKLGVAFHAKPIVKQKASATINLSGLDLLLHWLK